MSKRLITTNSELGSFRTCRKRHWFRYRERLVPKRKAKPLGVGSATHAGVAAMYQRIQKEQQGILLSRPLSADELMASALNAMRGKLGEFIAHLSDAMANAQHPEDIEKLIDESKSMETEAESSVTRFVERFGPDDGMKYVVLAAEHPFEVPLLDADGRDGSRISWAGVMDLVLFDPSLRDYIVGEHKTTSQDALYADLRLDLDSQTKGYVYALHGLLKSPPQAWGLAPIEDAKVGRVFYNVVRKGGPKRPSINKDGTVSVAKCATTKEVYAQALEQAGVPAWAAARPAKWEELHRKQLALMESLPGVERFVARHEGYHGKSAVEEWRGETHADGRVMRWAEHENDPLPVTRNTNACNLPWMPACPYRSICVSDSPEAREFGFDVTTHQHIEIAEAKAEMADAAEDPDDFGF